MAPVVPVKFVIVLPVMLTLVAMAVPDFKYIPYCAAVLAPVKFWMVLPLITGAVSGPVKSMPDAVPVVVAKLPITLLEIPVAENVAEPAE